MKHTPLLFFGYIIFFFAISCDTVDTNNTEPPQTTDVSVSVSTEKGEYGLKSDSQAEITITNNSEESIYLNPSSQRPFKAYLGVQRQKRNDQWEYVDISDWLTGDRSLASREIKPGQTFGPDSVLLGPMLYRSGNYRFVYRLCPTAGYCDDDNEMLPFSSRISNTWKVKEEDIDLEIQTDRKKYDLAGSNGEAALSITNNTEEAFFLRNSDYLSLERQEGSNWETAEELRLNAGTPDDYYKIEPGETLTTEKYRVSAMTGFAATYRFVVELCLLKSECSEEEMLPLKMRVSNTFEIGQPAVTSAVNIMTGKTGLNLRTDEHIGVWLQNNREETVYLRDQSYVGYQRLENGQWVTVEESWFTESRTGAFLELKPGEKLEADMLSLERLSGRTGAYRFIYEICRNGTGCSEDELLPIAERTSNTWQVAESDFATHIFTKGTVYSLSESPDIKLGIKNESEKSLFLGGPEYLGLQRFSGGEWKSVIPYLFTVDTFPDYFEIKAGEQHIPKSNEDGLEVISVNHIHSNGGGYGTYRFIYELCSDNGGDAYSNCSDDAMLPEALRVSNAFRIVE